MTHIVCATLTVRDTVCDDLYMNHTGKQYTIVCIYYTHVCVYIYIYIYMCVCVCVCIFVCVCISDNERMAHIYAIDYRLILYLVLFSVVNILRIGLLRRCVY